MLSGLRITPVHLCLCTVTECEEEHDFSAGMQDFVSKLLLPLKHNRIVSVQIKSRERLNDCIQRQDAGERVSVQGILGQGLLDLCDVFI